MVIIRRCVIEHYYISSTQAGLYRANIQRYTNILFNFINQLISCFFTEFRFGFLYYFVNAARSVHETRFFAATWRERRTLS